MNFKLEQSAKNKYPPMNMVVKSEGHTLRKSHGCFCCTSLFLWFAETRVLVMVLTGYKLCSEVMIPVFQCLSQPV